MRDALEQYLEAKRLFDQATAVFESEPDLREAAVEIADGVLRTAREQLAKVIQQNGLPSVKAELGTGDASEAYRSSRALALKWLQEKADKEQRAQVLDWHGETFRAKPKQKSVVTVSSGLDDPGFSTSRGM